MLKDRILDTINKYKLIEKGEGVVVGVSGGPDSVCLLHVLNSLSENLKLRLFAVHINHMLRGEEADADQKYVESLCEKLGVPLYVRSFDIGGIAAREGISLEEAGREIRYREFDKISRDVGADKIAVAHNRNDQAETVLMNIMRGTGMDGLKGMDFKRGNIVRPLLEIDRKDIEEYCRIHSLNPRTDSSNLESLYTRNKIRLELIPHMSRLSGTDITESLFRMSRLIKEDSEFIEDAAIQAFCESTSAKDAGEICLDVEKLKKNPPAILKRVIRLAVREIKGNLKGIENVHVEKAVDLCINGQTGKQIHLPSGLKISKSYNVLKISKIKDLKKTPAFCEQVKIPGTTVIEHLDAVLTADILPNDGDFSFQGNVKNRSLVQFFDYNRLYDGIYIRNRKNGDVFKPYKSNGTKKLKEYFIDCKIPKEIRDEIPVIACGNEIVWIIGHKISDKFIVTENTKNILRLEYKCAK